MLKVQETKEETPNLNGWLAMALRASLLYFIFWNWVLGQAVLSRGILIVDWVEPSAQNTIPNSNNPSHKKASCAEIFSVLVSAEVPGLSPRGSAVCRTRPFSGQRGGINTSPLRPQRSSSSFFHSELDQSSLPLSKLGASNPLLKSLWFLEGFGSREWEAAREDHSPLFLCTWWSPSRLVCSLLLELGS
jgi:hypothetical protein